MLRVWSWFTLAVLLTQLCVFGDWDVCPEQYREPRDPMVDRSLLRHHTGIERLITRSAFDALFAGRHTLPGPCSKGIEILTFDGLVAAGRMFPDFANSGDEMMDALELAAFLATTSHETTGGWETAPCGRNAYGLCFVEEAGCMPDKCPGYSQQIDTCIHEWGFPCPPTPGKQYFGRGAIQLSYNYNYALYSKTIYGDPQILLDDPERVSNNSTLAWGGGIFFWMTRQFPKDSCHDVMTGIKEYVNPTQTSGFGLTTLIINGGVECSQSSCEENEKSLGRIRYLQRYTYYLGVPLCRRPNDVVLCRNMMPYPFPNTTDPRNCPPDYSLCEKSNIQTCPDSDPSYVGLTSPGYCNGWRGDLSHVLDPGAGARLEDQPNQQQQWSGNQPNQQQQWSGDQQWSADQGKAMAAEMVAGASAFLILATTLVHVI